MNTRKVVMLLCAVLMLFAFLRPKPAYTQQPEQPPYLIEMGTVISSVQAATAEDECAIVRTLIPQQPEVLISQANERLFIPTILVGGENCPKVSEYAGANVFIGNEKIIPILANSAPALQIGSLPVEKLQYSPNPVFNKSDIWARLNSSVPSNQKSLRLLGAWNITATKSSLVGVAQLGDSPVQNYPDIQESWRARAMDELIREGEILDFQFPIDTLVWRVPDKNMQFVDGKFNAYSIVALCPDLEVVTHLQFDITNFIFKMDTGPTGAEISAWGFLKYPEELVGLCPELLQHPWVRAGTAYTALDRVDKKAVDYEAKQGSTLWPNVSLSLAPNSLSPAPIPAPVMSDGAVEAMKWGGVIIVAVVVLSVATGQLEGLWVLALAP